MSRTVTEEVIEPVEVLAANVREGMCMMKKGQWAAILYNEIELFIAD